MGARKFIRFSLRNKVLIIFLSTVSVILLLSNYLFYLSSQNILVQDANQQNRVLSKEISSQIQISELGKQSIENLVGDELRIAALVAKYALNPDAAKISNQELVQLSHEIGITDITLLQPKNGDIVGVKSSDPKEINLSTKGWSGWFTAFQQLLEHKPVNVGFGESGPNYWSGPIANAASDPKAVDKWGYFYDGSTNYIIDPYVRDTAIKSYEQSTSPMAIVQSILQANPDILDISAFNPSAFGKKPIVWKADGASWVDIKNLPIIFGSYKYQDEKSDVRAVSEAYKSHQVVSFKDEINHQDVLKTFVPVSNGSLTYVIGFVTNYSVIESVLNQQMHDSILISVLLLILIAIVSYLVSGYITKPLTRITEKVSKLAEIQFDEPVPVRRNDEIGQLTAAVNDMSRNMSEYMYGLYESIRKERNFSMSFLGLVASALVHELRSPTKAILSLVDMFPTQGLSKIGEDIIGHMKLAADHLNSVVNEFSDFLKKGKLNLKDNNLSDIASEAIEMMQPIAQEQNIDIELSISTPGDFSVYVDRDKFRQVLMNLLKNGIESIAAESRSRRVQLQISSLRNYIVLDVVDSGTGIPRDRWESIFTPFKSTKTDGIGLGLALCKFIVLSSGGDIQVFHSDESGTTIRIKLPRNLSVYKESKIVPSSTVSVYSDTLLGQQ